MATGRTKSCTGAQSCALWQGSAPGSSEYRRLLVALLCAGLATFAQLYSPQGILPLISSDLHVDPARSALLISAVTMGLALGALPWAWLADRIGRLTALKLSMTLALFLGAAGVAVPWFAVILGLRVLQGLALGGVPALAIAYLHEEIRPTATAAAAALYVSGTSVGGLVGRLVAAPVAERWGWRAGVGAVLVLAAFATAVFVAIAPPAHGPRRRASTARQGRPAHCRVLRAPGMLALYGQGFLLMGAFVAIYNYLGFRLRAEPFALSTSVTSLLFLAYLAGTVSSQRAGRLAGRLGRLRVLLGSIAILTAGILLTMVDALPVIIVGLVVLTAGFFAAHAIAVGWTGARTAGGGAQAPALYNVAYYGGSSVMGWFGGIVFAGFGWSGLSGLTVGLVVLAAAMAALTLRGPERLA